MRRWLLALSGVVALLVAAAALFLGYAMRFPVLNDVSTDRTAAPAFLAEPPADGAYDAAALAGPTAQAYPDLENLRTDEAPDQVFAYVQHLVALRQWKVAAVDLEARRIQAVAVTPLLRFKDDVVVEVRAVGGGSEVAMRSKSRVGKGDLGANAKRIRAFLADLQGLL